MPPAKKARADTTPKSSADARLDELLSDVAAGSAAGVLLIAAMEWDAGSEAFTSEGKPSQDFFTRLHPFIVTLEHEDDQVARELFEEALNKPDEQALEEVGFLQRSGVIDDAEDAAMRAATPEDRKRMLFVSLLADSEKADDEEGEEGEEGENGEDDGEDEEGEEECEDEEGEEEDEVLEEGDAQS